MTITTAFCARGEESETPTTRREEERNLRGQSVQNPFGRCSTATPSRSNVLFSSDFNPYREYRSVPFNQPPGSTAVGRFPLFYVFSQHQTQSWPGRSTSRLCFVSLQKKSNNLISPCRPSCKNASSLCVSLMHAQSSRTAMYESYLQPYRYLVISRCVCLKEKHENSERTPHGKRKKSPHPFVVHASSPAAVNQRLSQPSLA